MHIFTQSGWLILFNPNHLSQQHQIGESRQTFSLFQNFFVQDRRNDCPLSSIAVAPPPWGKRSNLWTACVYSLRPRVPSWIWIRWIQYTTHKNNFQSPPVLAMLTAMQNHALTSSYFISGQHFLETFTLLPEKKKQKHKLMGTTTFLSSTNKHDFCYSYGDISHSHIQQCLSLTMHIFTQAFSCKNAFSTL